MNRNSPMLGSAVVWVAMKMVGSPDRTTMYWIKVEVVQVTFTYWSKHISWLSGGNSGTLSLTFNDLRLHSG
jgi:hypothetical protein